MSDWRELAACAGSDPDEWFHEARALPVVLEICAACPVLDECRTWALEAESGVGLGSRFGIFGGLTPRQRWAIDRDTHQDRAAGTACQEHIGTDAGYQRHTRLHEMPCDPCRAAHDQRRAAWRRRRRAAELARLDAEITVCPACDQRVIEPHTHAMEMSA